MNEKLWVYSIEKILDKLSNGSEYKVYDKKNNEEEDFSLKNNMN